MFDAIGRGGKTKKLSPLRWVAAFFIGLAMILTIWGVGFEVSRRADEAVATPTPIPEVVFKQTAPPPPPPPPPPAPPKSTTRPLRPVITKKVVKQEIKPPDPTPIPEKKPEEEKKEATPVVAAVEAEEGDGTGYGVPGGTGDPQKYKEWMDKYGKNGAGEGNVENVDVGEVKFLNPGDVQRVAKANFPEMIKRANIPVAEATVELVCAPDGSVSDVVWIEGNELLREAVMKAVRGARFEPRPIAFRVRIPFRFKLN